MQSMGTDRKGQTQVPTPLLEFYKKVQIEKKNKKDCIKN
jgi:hypothetical protein